MRHDFRALPRIKNFETTLRQLAEHISTRRLSPADQQLLKTFLAALPVSNAPLETRKKALMVCLQIVSTPKKSKIVKPAPSVSAPIQQLPGVGPKIAPLLIERGLRTVGDLLRFLPRRYEFRQAAPALRNLQEGEHYIVEGEVVAVGRRNLRGRAPQIEVAISDTTGVLRLCWFRAPTPQFFERFHRGTRLRARGQVKRFRGALQMVHPEVQFVEAESAASQDEMVPIYPEISPIKPGTLRKLIAQALKSVDELVDVVPATWRTLRKLPPLREAVTFLHHVPPTCDAQQLNDFATPWQRRLVYEELLVLQLAVLQNRLAVKKRSAMALRSSQAIVELAQQLFSFELTAAQRRVLNEIESDLRLSSPMHRLLQGDVGSGKTAVALTSAYSIMQRGHQVVLMAPTEILAEQHARSALAAFTKHGYEVGLLTGSISASERRTLLNKLADGSVQCVVGTHALIQDDVKFCRLHLAIIDEQHRFGVLQRAKLSELARSTAGHDPHVLVMTATPIPRTLAMTLYGDLDVSILDELPPGRTPIVTRVIHSKQRLDVYARVQRMVAAKRQAYVVVPLVEGSDKEGMEGVRAVTSVEAELRGGIFRDLRVGLLHGRMTGDDKDHVMQQFASGALDVLVATTVIEVGIDVPNASVMVIEHAERFGLSQLHQLRGRIGRGSAASECFLLASDALSDDAIARLRIMEQTNDGFKIAEEDLKLRGPGDFIGTRQAGLPFLSLADLTRDYQVLEWARADAKNILKEDAGLQKPENRRLYDAVMVSWREKLELARVG